MQIDTWYGSRFADSNVITQFYYGATEIMGQTITNPRVDFFNLAPNEFDALTHHYIVAVWHIKPKQLA
jgi:hypothetical protein